MGVGMSENFTSPHRTSSSKRYLYFAEPKRKGMTELFRNHCSGVRDRQHFGSPQANVKHEKALRMCFEEKRKVKLCKSPKIRDEWKNNLTQKVNERKLRHFTVVGRKREGENKHTVRSREMPN